MMRVANLLILIIAVLMTSCFKDDESESLGETSGFLPGDGIVTYSGYAPLADRPVRIHFHIPVNGDMKKMPVLFVFPGLERNADDYLNAWRAEASNREVMVFVFEFPTETYSTAQYIEGGMFQGNTLLDRSEWTFSLIESVFDTVRKDTGSSRNKYDVWGHSAGAQFVHRYVTFMLDTRVDRAVSANAGWYTDRNGLNTSAGAEAQGANRYQRGKYYFSEAKRISTKDGCSLNWDKYEVAGVAHEYAKMAAAGAKILY